MIWDWNTESFLDVWSHDNIMQDIELPGTDCAMVYENIGYLFYPLERPYKNA